MHTHYHPESQTWFTLDTCEHCGGDVQAANAVKVSKDQQLKLLTMGVKIVDTLPVEGYWSDAVEGEQCDNCIDDHDITLKVSPDVARALAAATITLPGMEPELAQEIIAMKRALRRKLRRVAEPTDEVHYTQEREFPYVSDGDVTHD